MASDWQTATSGGLKNSKQPFKTWAEALQSLLTVNNIHVCKPSSTKPLYDSICIVLFGSTTLNTDVVVQYVTVK